MKLKLLLGLFFLLLLVGSVLGAPVAPNSGNTVAYYKFEETTGTTADNAEGTSARDGTISGATIDQTGKIDKAFSFDGTNDYVDTFDWNLPDSFSISFWYKTNGAMVNNGRFLAKGNSGGSATDDITFTHDSTGRYDFRMGFGGSAYLRRYGGTVRTDTWTHIVVTVTSKTTVSLYENGESVSLTSGDSGTLTNYVNTNRPLRLAMDEFYTTLLFTGVIDEVGFFDVALSQDEIDYLYASGSPGSAQQYPFSGEPVVNNFTVTAKNVFDNTTINNFSIDIDSETYTTTTGSITTHILQTDTNAYTVFVYDAENNQGIFFNRTYSSVDVSSNLVAELTQSTVTFQASQIISDATINDYWFGFFNNNNFSDATTYQRANNAYASVKTWTSFGNQSDLMISSIQNELRTSYSSYTASARYKFTYVNESTAYSEEQTATSTSWAVKTFTNPYPDSLIKQVDLELKQSTTFAGRFAEAKNHLFIFTDLKYALNTSYVLNAGTYNLTAYKEGYFVVTQEKTILAGVDQTIYFSNLSTTILNITAQNYFTENLLNNISGWISNSAYSWNQSFNTSNNFVAYNIIPGSYTVYLTAEGYTNIDTSNTKTIIISDQTHEDLVFSLYTTNSVNVYIYDENTLSQITGTNITVIFTGLLSEKTYSTTTGFLFVDDLEDGNYTVKFSGGEYLQKNYVVTVAEGSTQTLNAYLSSSSKNAIFEITDIGTGATLESASIMIERLIDDSWVVVETKSTDISGRAQISYLDGVKYRFSVTLVNYDTKIFILDPVIFSTYTVKLKKSVIIDNAGSYQGVSIFYTPSSFAVGQLNNFTIIFSSPQGALINYNVSVVYPGGSDFFEGNLSAGQSFNALFNITSANLTDKVTVSYCYDATITPEKCFVKTHSISGTQGTGGFKDKTYGMGLFTRISVATLIILIVAGLVGLVGGVLMGGFTGLFMAGFLVASGFIPVWAILPTMAVGFFLLAGRSSQ